MKLKLIAVAAFIGSQTIALAQWSGGNPENLSGSANLTGNLNIGSGFVPFPSRKLNVFRNYVGVPNNTTPFSSYTTGLKITHRYAPTSGSSFTNHSWEIAADKGNLFFHYTNTNKSWLTLSNDGKLGIGTTTPPAARLDISMPHEEEVIIRSEVANTYSGFSFRHNDGTENWRIRSYSNYGGGYGNTLGIISKSSGNFWVAAEKTLIGDAFDFSNCTDCGDYNLFVKKGVRAEKVRVDVAAGVWADYVFDATYELKPLDELEQFIEENHHLPDVPSAENIEANGLDLAKTDALLLQKIEELTLYLIQQEKEKAQLVKELEQLKVDFKSTLNK